jgi:hypothetical protein
MTEKSIGQEWKPCLLFSNPVFQAGVNATVRLGEKWASRVHAEDIVEVYAHNAERRSYLFDAFIVDTIVAKICDIDEDLLEHEHDPSCREPQGLLAELRRVYGNTVSPRDKVTIILFEQCDPDPGEHDKPSDLPRMH